MPVLIAVIFAPGTKPPAVSVMVPLMVPSVWVWADSRRPAQKTKSAKEHGTRRQSVVSADIWASSLPGFCSAAFDVQSCGPSRSVNQKKWKNRKVKSRTLRYIVFLLETFNHPDIAVEDFA